MVVKNTFIQQLAELGGLAASHMVAVSMTLKAQLATQEVAGDKRYASIARVSFPPRVTDGCSMMQRFKRFRKSKTDRSWLLCEDS